MRKDVSTALEAVGWKRKGRTLSRTNDEGVCVSYDGRTVSVTADGGGFSTDMTLSGADGFLFIWQMWSLFAVPSRRRNVIMALCDDGWTLGYRPSTGFVAIRDAGPLHCLAAFDTSEHLIIRITAGRKTVYEYREEFLCDCREAVDKARRIAIQGELVEAYG